MSEADVYLLEWMSVTDLYLYYVTVRRGRTAGKRSFVDMNVAHFVSIQIQHKQASVFKRV